MQLAPFFSPFPVILISHHTSQKYKGTLCLFLLSNPAHHADPALALDQVADVLSHMNPCPWALLLLIGRAAGIIGWLGTFPFDVIKMRMQAYGISTSPSSSAGKGMLWHTAQELYAEAGGSSSSSSGCMGIFWQLVASTLVTSPLPLIFPHASLAGFSMHCQYHLQYCCHRGHFCHIRPHAPPPPAFAPGAAMSLFVLSVTVAYSK